MRPLLDAQTEELLRNVERINTISQLHYRTFHEFKGCNAGKDVVLVGAGPSVSIFTPLKDCIYVGLNKACLIENISFDYLFSIDKMGIDTIYNDFASYPCVKFVGDQNLGPDYQIPESEIQKMGDVRRYKTDANLFHKSQCALDLESQPLANYNSVSLQAMQFILYTNPRRIYLVGIDCSSLGHFNQTQTSFADYQNRLEARGEGADQWAKNTITAWMDLKKFVSTYYPNTEIVSINPVGLKGLFQDFYQSKESTASNEI